VVQRGVSLEGTHNATPVIIGGDGHSEAAIGRARAWKERHRNAGLHRRRGTLVTVHLELVRVLLLRWLGGVG
jgi:hypothetical protein